MKLLGLWWQKGDRRIFLPLELPLLRLALFTQSVLFHAADEGAPADVEVLRGLRLVPVEAFQSTQDELALDAFQADPLLGQLQDERIARRRGVADVGGVGRARRSPRPRMPSAV